MSIEGKPVNLLEQFVGETLTTFIPGSWGIYQPCTVHTRRGAFVPDLEFFHPEAKSSIVLEVTESPLDFSDRKLRQRAAMRVSEKDKRFGGSAVLYKQHFASAKMYFSALHVVEDLSKGAINSNRARKKLGAMVGYDQNLTRFAVTDSYLGLLFEQLMILQDQRVESI